MPALLHRLQTAIGKKSADDGAVAPPASKGVNDEEKKNIPVDDVAAVNGSDGSQDGTATEDQQRGVSDVEAVTQTWSKGTLIAIFANIWCLYMVYAFQSGILNNLVPFVTSEFDSHSQLSVIYIVADAMNAALYIPLSRILDTWGRAEGFLMMMILATLGMIMMAACHNLATFCAAYVFYSIGFGGMIFAVDVLTADMSKLKNRGLAYAFTSSPFMITAFAAPKAAESFYEDINWRWGFGLFSILLPVVASPIFFILKSTLKKAKAQGFVSKERSNRTAMQSLWHYVVEFDALGVLIFTAGLVIFLLPFNLAFEAPNGWKTDYIIAMLVLGFVLLVAFAVYESWFAPVPMLNYKLLTDRTVIGACALGATYMVSYYCWYYYFTSFLQVVNNVGMAEAGYITNTFSVVSGVLLLLVGYLIHRTGYFKWLLYIAVPIYVLAQGLMIYFRQPNQSVGFLVMCQVFISFGGSIFILIQQVAVLAAVDHQHVAAALALLFVVGNIGGAVGATISGTIWTNTFYDVLARNLPESILPDIDTIYSDITAQLAFEPGTPERTAIQESYAYSQTRMLAAGTAIMGLGFIWMLLIRNINVAKIKQVKGVVF